MNNDVDEWALVFVGLGKRASFRIQIPAVAPGDLFPTRLPRSPLHPMRYSAPARRNRLAHTNPSGEPIRSGDQATDTVMALAAAVDYMKRDLPAGAVAIHAREPLAAAVDSVGARMGAERIANVRDVILTRRGSNRIERDLVGVVAVFSVVNITFERSDAKIVLHRIVQFAPGHTYTEGFDIAATHGTHVQEQARSSRDVHLAHATQVTHADRTNLSVASAASGRLRRWV